jgi:hypothetical protein
MHTTGMNASNNDLQDLLVDFFLEDEYSSKPRVKVPLTTALSPLPLPSHSSWRTGSNDLCSAGIKDV